MGMSRRLFGVALVAAFLVVAGLEAGALAAPGSRGSADPGGASPWVRWQRAWLRLDSLEVSARTLDGLADLDGARTSLLDSLCDAACPARGVSGPNEGQASAWERGTA
jgi:hypothetical protein